MEIPEQNIFYYPINTGFDTKLLNDFVNFVNNVAYPSKIKILLTSPGGDVHVLYSLLHIINSNPQMFEIIVTEETHSCALFMILLCDCEVKMLHSYGGGILHKIYVSLTTNEQTKASVSDNVKITLTELKRVNTKLIKFLKDIGIEEDKIKRISKGEDVILTPKEIRLYIQNKTKLNMSFNLEI